MQIEQRYMPTREDISKKDMFAMQRRIPNL
jgi:hypothetical protein